MTSLAQYKTALEGRSDVVQVSDWFPIDKSDADRVAISAAVKRRIEFVKTLSDGNTIITYEDRGVIGYGVDGNGLPTFDGTETVIDQGAGPAKEAPDQKDAFRTLAENWASSNLASKLSSRSEPDADRRPLQHRQRG